MNFFEAILLGLVQGITEFLPVSSSGHLTLFGKIFQTDPDAMLSYATWLHMGTLIAVVLVMRKELLAIFRDLFGKRTIRLVIATIPAVVAALLFGDWFESLFAGQGLGYGFLATGVILLLLVLLKPREETSKSVGYREALLAGIAQAFAIIPAISRSGSTLAALLVSGVNRRKAIRFSFLMSLPAILGGFLLDVVKIFTEETPALSGISVWSVAIGVIAAAISGYLVMEFMLRKLNDRGFLISAAYVIGLGTLILIDQTWLHLVF
jgi:undecaprenyl-diphosphatase